MQSKSDQEFPIIGITTYGRDEKGNFYLPAAYVDAVRLAGGLPVLLPPGETHLEPILQTCDGMILAGGGDIDPGRYGASSHPTVERVDGERDTFEIQLARRLVQQSRPVLGICRGMQILNVATGGDLVVHIPEKYGTRVVHSDRAKNFVEHEVSVDPESHLAKILQAVELPTASKHHQAVLHVAPDWRVVARAPDGVIEAMEHIDHPWLIAVQWHPELTLQDLRQRRLFEALVEAARARRMQREQQNKGD
ncbi:MAG: gamma-glutamyl-gamma-aminobutyrate hydrolase family protein [Calditrichaeota bacterium]|nr:MAG: gamma-glutamyl-gamma-aminobutyrate hydrolase family protein [Calditrichota bacterium]